MRKRRARRKHPILLSKKVVSNMLSKRAIGRVLRGGVYYLDGNAIRGINCQCVVSKYHDTVVVGRKPIYLTIGRADGKTEILKFLRYLAIRKATRGKYCTYFPCEKKGVK